MDLKANTDRIKSKVMQLKSKFTDRQLKIGAIIICGILVVIIAVSFISAKSKEEKYDFPIRCYHEVLSKYGDQIKLLDAYYAYYNPDKEALEVDPDSTLTSTFDPGKYVYFDVELNLDGEKEEQPLIFNEDGPMFWSDMDRTDAFSTFWVNSRIKQFQVALMELLSKDVNTIGDINNEVVGAVPLDKGFIKSHAK